MKKTVYFLFLITISTFAQIKGVVKDSITGKSISYVNISVENENIGTTSEENGEFSIHTSVKSKILIFSAIGFEKKRVKIAEASIVNLKPKEYQIDEIVISKKIGTRTVEIGETNSEIYQAFDNGPKIVTKYFPYLTKYKKTKFIKQVVVSTDSQIDNAAIRIHFYSVDANGYPKEELLDKDFIVTVNKGLKKTIFNVSEFNLRIPKNGIFVGFEKLIIEKNKTEKIIKDFNSNTSRTQITYYPFLLYNRVENEFLYLISGGKWIRQENGNLADKKLVDEPAINLILSN